MPQPHRADVGDDAERRVPERAGGALDPVHVAGDGAQDPLGQREREAGSARRRRAAGAGPCAPSRAARRAGRRARSARPPAAAMPAQPQHEPAAGPPRGRRPRARACASARVDAAVARQRDQHDRGEGPRRVDGDGGREPEVDARGRRRRDRGGERCGRRDDHVTADCSLGADRDVANRADRREPRDRAPLARRSACALVDAARLAPRAAGRALAARRRAAAVPRVHARAAVAARPGCPRCGAAAPPRAALPRRGRGVRAARGRRWPTRASRASSCGR